MEEWFVRKGSFSKHLGLIHLVKHFSQKNPLFFHLYLSSFSLSSSLFFFILSLLFHLVSSFLFHLSLLHLVSSLVLLLLSSSLLCSSLVFHLHLSSINTYSLLQKTCLRSPFAVPSRAAPLFSQGIMHILKKASRPGGSPNSLGKK